MNVPRRVVQRRLYLLNCTGDYLIHVPSLNGAPLNAVPYTARGVPIDRTACGLRKQSYRRIKFYVCCRMRDRVLSKLRKVITMTRQKGSHHLAHLSPLAAVLIHFKEPKEINGFSKQVIQPNPGVVRLWCPRVCHKADEALAGSLRI